MDKFKIRKTLRSEDIRKNAAYSARKERKADRTEICDVARRTIDNGLGAKFLYEHFKVELEADMITWLIPLVPTPLVVDEELNKNL